ncbi:hypothetical protein ACFVXG_00810 [Kitasatospora sp. NPDC058162]
MNTTTTAEQPVLVIENLDQPGDVAAFTAATFCRATPTAGWCIRTAHTEA